MADINGQYNVYGTGGIIGKANSYIYEEPTVCIGRKGTIDCPLFLNEKFWCVDTLFYSHINTEKAVPKFVYYLFETIDWKKKDQSTGVPSLTSHVIEHTKVSIPSINNQNKISHFLSFIDDRIQTQSKIIEDLIALKNGLLETVFKLDDSTQFAHLSDLVSISTGKRDANEASLNGLKRETYEIIFMLHPNLYYIDSFFCFYSRLHL